MEEYQKAKHEISQKNPNKGLIATLVIAVILAIAAVGGTWYYMNNKAKNDKKAQDAQIQQLQKQIDDLGKQTTSTDEVTNWSTYNDAYDKLSFKYPKDWKLTETDKSAEYKYPAEWKGPFTFVDITSPSGFKLSLTNHIQGIGGNCDAEQCPQNKFYSDVKVTTLSNGVELHLVKYELLDPSGKQIIDRKIGFIGINPNGYKPQLTDYQGFPPYFYFDSPGVDGVLSGFSGPEAESNYRSDLTTQQYFSLPDLKTAEKILQTVKQNIN